MSRVAEIAVQTSIPSSGKPNRAETRDPNGFSALVDGEVSVAAEAGAAMEAGKAVQSAESNSPGPKALPSLEQLMGLLPGAPANNASEALAAGVTEPGETTPDEIVAQALAALSVAAQAGVAADGTTDSSVADAKTDAAKTDAASTDAQTPASSASAAVVATVIVAPASIVSNIVATTSDPQAVPGSLGKVTPPVDTGLPSAAQADARLAATMPAVTTPAAPAETASPDNMPLNAVPVDVSVKAAETHFAKRPVAVHPEAANAPLSPSTDASVAAGAVEAGSAAADIHTAAPAPVHHEQTHSTGDGLQKDGLKDGSLKESGRTDAAPAAPSDAKPAIAAPTVASAQAQPTQQTADNLAIAPAVAVTAPSATQPALLQAQLMATPAAPDTPVPVDGLAVEIAVRATSGKSRFEIRLDPPELGRIDVRLDIDRHGRVGTHLVVEKAETLDMLRRDAPQLERALADSGLKTSDGGLQFSLRDQSFAGRGDQNEGRQPDARLIVSEDDIVPAAVAERSYRTPGAAGGLDIRV